MTEESVQKKTKSSFKIRVWSAMIFGPIVLIALYAGGLPFTLMMAAAAGIGVYEWGKMVLSGQKHRAVLMLFGIAYIGFSIGMMVWLRNFSDYGLYNTLTLLLIVWTSDIFAYFTGKTIGGPKLAPKISPKKTWAGFIGSSVGAGIVATGLTCPLALEKWDVTTIGNMSWTGYAAMGFILAMFGQAGDLFISIVKRYYKVKDTGTLIPGHGGILDRIDALLLVALLFGILVILLK
ncbi:MAG: phosphatidate cytidylyltransferase [Alphaproteobacteria bacterium]|nr:phosphatidate cytidylyltransferase [Alphaproteobacteria bacterium]MCK5659173.1 phosphatidate cytidylyltransferase [Alphaproteobacteria bacterium]